MRRKRKRIWRKKKQDSSYYDLTDMIENLNWFLQKIKNKKAISRVFAQEDLDKLFLLLNGIQYSLLSLFAKDLARFRLNKKSEKE